MTFKKIAVLLGCLVLTLPMLAQVDKIESSNLNWAIENIVFIMGGLTIVGTMFGLYGASKMIWQAQSISKLEAAGMSHGKAVQQTHQSSFLNFIYREMAGTIPLEQEVDIMLNHNYDGIQELDNNLPPWWVGMFYATIIFAGVYMTVYHFTDIGQSNVEAYEQEVRDAEIAIAAYNQKQKEEKAAATDNKELSEKEE